MNIKSKYIIGFVLCLISTITIIYLFDFFKAFAVIPVALLAVILISVILVYLVLRIPISDYFIIESRIKYQLIDLGQGDFYRGLIERQLNNRRVFLADVQNGIKWLYVKESDFKKLWPESPLEMMAKNYTIRAKFEIRKLLFGGFSNAKVIEIHKIYEEPIVRK